MFQYDFGPLKHVLHLVWSVFGISKAIKTALKVALYDFFDGPRAPLNGQFMEKVNHYNRTKHKDFLMGPSVKFVLEIIDSVSPQKMGLKYKLSAGLLGGGVGPLSSKRLLKKSSFFYYLPKYNKKELAHILLYGEYSDNPEKYEHNKILFRYVQKFLIQTKRLVYKSRLQYVP